MIMLEVEPGATYYLTRGTFIPTVSTTDDNKGYLWIGSYGAFEKHNVPAGESITVNNGLFLAATKKYDTIVKLGKSLVSSFFGKV